jgi:hypothetical protein
MLSAKKQMADGKSAKGKVQGSRPLSNCDFDEAVLKVQEWNEVLRCRSAVFSPYCVTFPNVFLPSAAQTLRARTSERRSAGVSDLAEQAAVQ